MNNSETRRMSTLNWSETTNSILQDQVRKYTNCQSCFCFVQNLQCEWGHVHLCIDVKGLPLVEFLVGHPCYVHGILVWHQTARHGNEGSVKSTKI